MSDHVRSDLPYLWQDWARFETRPGFIAWAEDAPIDPRESRYAVVRWNGIRWARVSPNPDVSPDYSAGCFYDETIDGKPEPGGAVEAAKRAVPIHRAKMRALIG